jgi:ABC-type transporter Mla subunit MlaD
MSTPEEEFTKDRMDRSDHIKKIDSSTIEGGRYKNIMITMNQMSRFLLHMNQRLDKLQNDLDTTNRLIDELHKAQDVKTILSDVNTLSSLV